MEQENLKRDQGTKFQNLAILMIDQFIVEPVLNKIVASKTFLEKYKKTAIVVTHVWAYGVRVLTLPFWLAWYVAASVLQFIGKAVLKGTFIVFSILVIWAMFLTYRTWICPFVLKYFGEYLPTFIKWLFFEWDTVPTWYDFMNRKGR